MKILSDHMVSILQEDDDFIYRRIREYLETHCDALINHDLSGFSLGFYDDDELVPEEELTKGELYVVCCELVPIRRGGPPLRFLWRKCRATADFGYEWGPRWRSSIFWKISWRNRSQLQDACQSMTELSRDFLQGELYGQTFLIDGRAVAWKVVRCGRTVFRKRSPVAFCRYGKKEVKLAGTSKGSSSCPVGREGEE